MKPKISLLHFNIGKFGGAEIYILQAAQALQTAGAEVNAISSLLPVSCKSVEGIPHRGLLPSHKGIQRVYLGLLNKLHLRQVVIKRALARYAANSEILVAGHVNILPPVIEFAQNRNKKVWLVVYGIDIWKE